MTTPHYTEVGENSWNEDRNDCEQVPEHKKMMRGESNRWGRDECNECSEQRVKVKLRFEK